MAGIIVEADQRESGVALDHGVWVVQHSEQRGVKFLRSIVLAHDPGVGDADFVNRIFRKDDHLRIPAADGGIAFFDACFELREDVLDFAGMAAVGEGAGDLIIGDGAAEPGGVPEKKRHQDEEQSQNEDSESPATAERFLWLCVGSHLLVIGCHDGGMRADWLWRKMRA